MFRFHYVEPVIMLMAIVRWVVLAIITGIAVGSATSLFLHGLSFILEHRTSLPFWFKLVALPAGGLLNGLLIYYGYAKFNNKFSDSVITSIHKQGGRMPYRSLLVKPVAALITLSSGGSAGKTGPCSQMGGIIASWIGSKFRLDEQLQKQIVVCGVAAGFAGVFGIPIAAAFYGIELISVGKLRHQYIFPAVIASIASVEISKFWRVPYKFFPLQHSSNFDGGLAWKVLVIGVLCGITAWIFVEIFEEIGLLFEYMKRRFRLWPPMMPLLGGVLLAMLFLIIPGDYFSLGMPLLEQTLNGNKAELYDVLFKMLLVAITLGSGFYGGIVTPLFLIGGLAGNVFGQWFGISPALGAAIGLIAVIASASNTPIAASFMGLELFSGLNAVYAVTACMAAYIAIGHRSVHPEQIMAHPKSAFVYMEPGSTLQEKGAHTSYRLLRRMRKMQSSWKAWQRFIPHYAVRGSRNRTKRSKKK